MQLANLLSMQEKARIKEPANAVFRALSDQTRRDVLRLLREGPMTSGEIASVFDSSWPTVSRHLAVLREAGLVVTERIGQEIYYELNTSVFQELVQHLLEWVQPEVRDVESANFRRGGRGVRGQRGRLATDSGSGLGG